MIEQIVRQEFEKRASDVSAEILAERIVNRIVDIVNGSRNELVGQVVCEICCGPSSYSREGSDYDEEVALDISAEDVIARLEGFLFSPRLTSGRTASPE